MGRMAADGGVRPVHAHELGIAARSSLPEARSCPGVISVTREPAAKSPPSMVKSLPCKPLAAERDTGRERRYLCQCRTGGLSRWARDFKRSCVQCGFSPSVLRRGARCASYSPALVARRAVEPAAGRRWRRFRRRLPRPRHRLRASSFVFRTLGDVGRATFDVVVHVVRDARLGCDHHDVRLRGGRAVDPLRAGACAPVSTRLDRPGRMFPERTSQRRAVDGPAEQITVSRHGGGERPPNRPVATVSTGASATSVRGHVLCRRRSGRCEIVLRRHRKAVPDVRPGSDTTGGRGKPRALRHDHVGPKSFRFLEPRRRIRVPPPPATCHRCHLHLTCRALEQAQHQREYASMPGVKAGAHQQTQTTASRAESPRCMARIKARRVASSDRLRRTAAGASRRALGVRVLHARVDRVVRVAETPGGRMRRRRIEARSAALDRSPASSVLAEPALAARRSHACASASIGDCRALFCSIGSARCEIVRKERRTARSSERGNAGGLANARAADNHDGGEAPRTRKRHDIPLDDDGRGATDVRHLLEGVLRSASGSRRRELGTPARPSSRTARARHLARVALILRCHPLRRTPGSTEGTPMASTEKKTLGHCMHARCTATSGFAD